MWFRFFDILISGSVLVLLSPLLLICSLVSYCFGEGDVLYRQRRSGKAGVQFDVIKFATMTRDSPKTGAGLFVEKNDSRMLPHGGLFRASKLNELPQLFNVLLGDMSLVGFRPLVPSTFERALKLSNGGGYQTQPGLTSLASILGRSEERELSERNNRAEYYFECLLPQKVKLDDWWAEHKSLKLYITVLAATVMVVAVPPSNIPQRMLKRLSGIEDLLASSRQHTRPSWEAEGR